MYQSIEALNTNQLNGLVVLEFGANWCGICKAAQPMIDQEFIRYPTIQRVKIEDAKGKRLGRLHAIKLWPTLIFLLDGVEIERLVRPTDAAQLEATLKNLVTTANKKA